MESPAQALRYVPQTQNILLSAFSLTLQIAGIFLAPLIWAWSGWAFVGYMLAYGYATMLCWLMIHEAVHYKLLVNRSANILLGRLHGITFGCPFHILKIGHMTHHRYNRGALDSSELMPAEERRPLLWALTYYARLFGALYLSEVISPLVFFFWKRVKRLIAARSKNRALVALLDLFTRRMVQAIQFDALLCVAFFAVQIWSNRFDLRPFFILFFWRGFIVSFYDNAYHYGTDPHDRQAASNLAMPRVLQTVMLNHNLHRLHHHYPTASWAVLREFQKQDADSFDSSLARTIWAQLKGPVRRPTSGSPGEMEDTAPETEDDRATFA
jgi:fatty acid desaturase